MKDFSSEIEAYALRNAIEFGKAEVSRILPKLFNHGLEKSDIGKIMPVISDIVSKVNSLNKQDLELRYAGLQGVVKTPEIKEKELFSLPDVSGSIVTRLPPEPSKYLHIGHAISFLLNSMLAEKHDGKVLLRFEDCNPEKCTQEYVDAIQEDIVDYLGIEPDAVSFVSDDMKKFYSYAEQLIQQEDAYMCFCDREKMQENRHNGIECACRVNSEKKNLKAWKEFLKGKYPDGLAVLRFKGDMQNLNHIMRDPVLFRYTKTKHFRLGKKYLVWPLYDFYNPIEDSISGVTHVLRSAEFEQRAELHEMIKKKLNLQTQEFIHYGRFTVLEGTTKGREIRELVESGEYIGWDDPRLVTLKALRRRGISREVLMELVKQVGFSKKEAKIDFDMIASLSRKLLDTRVDRYYFVENPIKIQLDSGVKEVEIKFHPDKKETRKVKVDSNIYISKHDFNDLKGKEVRLMNLATIQLPKTPGKSKFISLDNAPVQKIQWVSAGIPVKIFLPDATWLNGMAEPSVKKLQVGEIVQFERFGFCRLDKKGKELEFWFSHN